MQRQLNEIIGEVAETVKQMAQFMMGKGPVTLSDSLRDAIVAGVKEEFEAKLREEREAHSKEMQSLKDQFALMLAAKDNEIAALKAKNGDNQGESHGTTTPGQPVPEGMAPEDRIKQLEQQKNKCAIDAYGQSTESEKYNHGCQNPVKSDDLDLEGIDVPDERCVEIARQVMTAVRQRKDMKGIEKPRKFQPLEEAALTGIEVCDQRLPNKGEKEEDVEKDKHYCSEITDIIIRVSCLVHMRRPFFKLKDCSQDAIDIVHFADEVFHRDKLIKATYRDDFDKIAQERVLQIGPILQSIKDKLDILEKELDPEKEPELVKAVKYALKEYPCLLHCLKNGALDFSNNSVEREIRRLAKYRNNSFFVGSPDGGIRLARTLTIFANCKECRLLVNKRLKRLGEVMLR